MDISEQWSLFSVSCPALLHQNCWSSASLSSWHLHSMAWQLDASKHCKQNVPWSFDVSVLQNAVPNVAERCLTSRRSSERGAAFNRRWTSALLTASTSWAVFPKLLTNDRASRAENEKSHRVRARAQLRKLARNGASRQGRITILWHRDLAV